jgi:hypothetical protein
MPFVSRKLGIAYFPIPKNCGTSIRHLLYQIEHGVQFRSFTREGRTMELWMRYPAVPIADVSLDELNGLSKIVVVRDPVERLVSVYRNRVRHYGEIETADFDALGLPSTLPRAPDFDAFCAHLPQYRKIVSINHHTRPQSVYIGSDLGLFDHVFRFERLNDLISFLSDRNGSAVTLPRLRTEGAARSEISISGRSYDLIARYYRADYARFEGLYSVARS